MALIGTMMKINVRQWVFPALASSVAQIAIGSSAAASVIQATPAPGSGGSVPLAPTCSNGSTSDEACQNPRTGASSSDGPAAGEIIITATKRNERLINIPGAITVIDGDRLRELKVESLNDLQSYVPGLSVVSGGAPGLRQVIIQGIDSGSSGTNAALAAIYVDDMPLSSSGPGGRPDYAGVDPNPFDVASVEVLKGPQGTLYGANAMGGIVRYILRKPDLSTFDAEFGGALEAIDSAAHLGWEGRGAVSVPLVTDHLAIRLSGMYRNNAGYIRNPTRNLEDYNKSTEKAGTASILWKPIDAVTVRATVLAQDVENPNGIGVASLQPGTNLPMKPYQFSSPLPDLYFMKTRHYALHADWNLGFATLTSSTSYSRNSLSTSQSVPGLGFFCLPDPVTGTGGCPDYPNADALASWHNPLLIRKFTQEIRLTSDTSNRLQWMLGGFYTRERADEFQDFPLFKPDGTKLTENLYQTSSIKHYTERAAFANLTYSLTDHFDVSGGLRYSQYKEDYAQGEQTGLLVPGGVPAINTQLPWQNVWNWMANARYHFNRDLTAYVRVASGFRPGYGCEGCNPPVPGAPKSAVVNPDRTIDYEAGIRGYIADGKLFADLSLFDIEWRDIQLNEVLNEINFGTNGGTARSRGVEAALSYRPFKGLQLNGTIAHINAELTEDTVLGTGGKKGDPLPNGPKWAYYANVDYSHPLSADVDLHLGAGYRYHSGSSQGFADKQTFISPMKIVDAYAGLTVRNIELRVTAKNLFNRVVYEDIDTTSGFGFLNMPRTVYLSADVKF
jgi:outer membrane receptor protein involved in Fe transport